jgi:cytochrome c553
MRALLLALLLLAAPAAAAEEESVLAEGEGRSEVFAFCTGCHASAVIRRSRLSRPQWDGLLDWMTEKHAMPALDGEMRALVLDYLARSYGPAPRGGRSPFLN